MEDHIKYIALEEWMEYGWNMVSNGTLKQLINSIWPYGPQTSTEGSRAYRGPRGWESGFKKIETWWFINEQWDGGRDIS